MHSSKGREGATPSIDEIPNRILHDLESRLANDQQWASDINGAAGFHNAREPKPSGHTGFIFNWVHIKRV